MKFKLILLVLTILQMGVTYAQLKTEDLQIDTTITGFHYATNFQGVKVYTKNVASDIGTVNPSAFSVTIEKNIDYGDAKNQLQLLLKLSERNGCKITNLVKRDTVINNNKTFQISYTETNDSIQYKNFVFNAFVIKDKTVILFLSGDLDKGIYIEKFKKTFYRLKI